MTDPSKADPAARPVERVIEAEAEKSWHAVRCVFSEPSSTSRKWFRRREVLYEERITLWLAIDADEALEMALREGREYAEAVGSEATGYADCFTLFDTPEHGGEVYSLIRRSRLSTFKYVRRFFDTGTELAEFD